MLLHDRLIAHPTLAAPLTATRTVVGDDVARPEAVAEVA
jgi:hypothetical protein